MSKVDGAFDFTGAGVAWQAHLSVWTTDIAQLMAEGLHFTSANVCREKGALIRNAQQPHILRERACQTSRRIVLKHRAKNPLWEAILIVFACEMETLGELCISGDPAETGCQMSPDSVFAANGYNKEGEHVYSYTARTPNSLVNTLFDTPLDGWWPRLKPERRVARKPDRVSAHDQEVMFLVARHCAQDC